MDSLTQAVLGAGIAGAVAPAGHRRKALLLGAALGTLPDLDVLIDYGGAVENFTMHRGFSHSLFVLAPFTLILWWVLGKFWSVVREAPLRWLAVVGLALVTHPLLDAHTAYGTQLLWPLDVPPTMWATVFIIDPLFTLPLLVATVVTAFRPNQGWSTPLLRGALTVALGYLAWTWFAQAKVHHEAQEVLAGMGLRDAPAFVTPTPFNSVLWRIVVRTEAGYLEGFGSVMPGAPPIGFQAYASDQAALAAASDVWAVRRLRWFSRDFVRAEVKNGQLLLSDLRMGQEPFYVFTHVVAERGSPHWRAIPTKLLPFEYDRSALFESLRRMWTH
jgi:inner membrane protein